MNPTDSRSRNATVPAQYLSIQYLRGLAAMMVVVHHARDPMPWLFNPLARFEALAHGVDVFFVISGFIMYAAARHEPPLDFARKRIIRIAPLYWLATITVVAIELAQGHGISRLNVIRSLSFVPFYNPTHDNLIWPLLVPGWTLNYEMFFYLLFGLALLSRRLLITLTVAISALVLIGWAGVPANALAVTYTDPLLLEFLAGIWLGFASQRFSLRGFAPLLPLGLVALLLGDLSTMPRLLTYSVPAVAIVLGALALEARSTMPRIGWAKMLGDASYSLYLSHFIVMGMPLALFPHLPLTGWVQFVAFVLTAVALSLVVGLALHQWVERPVTRWLSESTRRKPLLPAHDLA